MARATEIPAEISSPPAIRIRTPAPSTAETGSTGRDNINEQQSRQVGKGHAATSSASVVSRCRRVGQRDRWQREVTLHAVHSSGSADDSDAAEGLLGLKRLDVIVGSLMLVSCRMPGLYRRWSRASLA